MFETMIAFLRTCPDLHNIKANFLGNGDGDISLQAVSGKPILYRYTDGASLRQCLFMISSKETAFSEKTADEFYESVTAWLETYLPELPGEKVAQKMEVTKTAAVAERDYTGLRYELTFRLVYYQKGE